MTPDAGDLAAIEQAVSVDADGRERHRAVILQGDTGTLWYRT
ncbi:hypothetical protein ABT186_28525 [Streptomyces sp. NPDC001634]